MSTYLPVDPSAGNIQIIVPPPPLQPKRRKRKERNYWPEEAFNAAMDEESLWKAVITQAVVDACSHSRRPEATQNKYAAIRWLTTGSDDFVTVCLSAGLDPSHVRKLAKKALLNPTLWRAEAGEAFDYESRKYFRKRKRRAERKAAREAAQKATTPAPCLIIHPFH